MHLFNVLCNEPASVQIGTAMDDSLWTICLVACCLIGQKVCVREIEAGGGNGDRGRLKKKSRVSLHPPPQKKTQLPV